MNAPGLELRGVAKRYGDRVALDDLELQVRPGEVFGFVGSNGAGKTTTMRIVLGVVSPDRGDIRWAGAHIGFDARRRIGYMPEERGLYPKMPIAEQLVYFAQLHGASAAAAGSAARRWLRRFGLEDRARDELQKLSLGNQQRVQLAAALVFEPIMLVLDEPFSGLDPEAVDTISEVLHECAADAIPVLFSSHQLELVERICDRVGVIQHGRLVACGSVDELRERGPSRLWVDAPAAPAGWTASLAGLRLVRAEGTRILLELRDRADAQAVLRAAIATGPVLEFRRDRPSLFELYREVVTEGRIDVRAWP